MSDRSSRPPIDRRVRNVKLRRTARTILWQHLHDEHDLILLDAELEEIIRLAHQARQLARPKKRSAPR